MGLLPRYFRIARSNSIWTLPGLYFPFRFCSRKSTCFRTVECQRGSVDGEVSGRLGAPAARKEDWNERRGESEEGRRTDRVVLEQAHGLRGPRAAEGVVEARHGLREQPDDYDAGFSCRALAFRTPISQKSILDRRRGRQRGEAYLSSPLWRHGRFGAWLRDGVLGVRRKILGAVGGFGGGK